MEIGIFPLGNGIWIIIYFYVYKIYIFLHCVDKSYKKKSKFWGPATFHPVYTFHDSLMSALTIVHV